MNSMKRRAPFVIGLLVLSVGVVLSYQNCTSYGGGGSNVAFSCSKIQLQNAYNSSVSQFDVTQGDLAAACVDTGNTAASMLAMSPTSISMAAHITLTCASRWCHANNPSLDPIFGRVASPFVFTTTLPTSLDPNGVVKIKCDSNILNTEPPKYCESMVSNAPPVDRIIQQDNGSSDCSPCGCGVTAINQFGQAPSAIAAVESCSLQFCRSRDPSYNYGVLTEVSDLGAQTYFCSRAGGIN